VLSRWLTPVLAYRLSGVGPIVLMSALALIVAALLQVALRRALGTGGSFVTFVPAILLVASLGGLRPAAATVAVSTLYAVVTMPPGFGRNAPGLLTFVICVGVAGFTAALLKEAVAEVVGEREALRASEENYRMREALSPTMLWEADGEGRVVSASPALRAIAPAFCDDPGLGAWGDDAEATREAWARARRSGAPLVVHHRIATPDGLRWFRSRAFPHRDRHGRVLKWYGASEDVHDQRTAEEGRALLMREVDHRARNVLMVVQALVNLTRSDDVKSYARAVQDRIQALARTHGLLSQTGWTGVEIRQLLQAELAAFAGHVHLDGPEAVLAPVAVQPVGLLIHELAVNAAKYGALSRPCGSVAVRWRTTSSSIEFEWTERGGPELAGEPERKGFGSRLITATLADHRGQVAFDWAPDGLTARFTLHDAVSSAGDANPAHQGEAYAA
jgi:two-component sensor histidine kinase